MILVLKTTHLNQALHHDRLLIGGQTREPTFADGHLISPTDVAGQVDEFLRLEERVREDQFERVLLAVDDALLEGEEDLGQRHRRHGGPQGAPRRDIGLDFGDAQLEPFDVSGRRYCAVRGEIAWATVAPADVTQSLALHQGVIHGRSERAVDDLPEMLLAAYQVRGVENESPFRHNISGEKTAEEADLDGAELDRLSHVALAAELSTREVPYRQGAFGALGDDLGEFASRLVRSAPGSHDIAHADHTGLLREYRRRAKHAGRGGATTECGFPKNGAARGRSFRL